MAMENFPDVIELNVGGKLITTLLSTLTKDPESMLTAMFSGRHAISKDKDGRFFIDCDGHQFLHILNYLRFGRLPPKESIIEVHDIAEYFNIQSLVHSLEKHQILQHRKRIAELKNSLDLQKYEQLKEEAIQNMYASNGSSHEGKILHVFSTPDVCKDGYGYGTCDEHSCDYEAPVRNNINIPLTTNADITAELKICLGHELSQLGFGKYSFVFEARSLYCRTCNDRIECHHIALLGHKLVTIGDLYTSNDDKMYACN